MDQIKELNSKKYDRQSRSRKRGRSGGRRDHSPWYGLIGRLQNRIWKKQPATDFNQKSIVDHPIDGKRKKVTVKRRKTGGNW